MNVETKIRIDATTTVTLTEKELAVWAHLSGYDAKLIREKVTGIISEDDLVEVGYSLRLKLGAAQDRISKARNALRPAVPSGGAQE